MNDSHHSTVDFAAFDVLTFDCYGTLIDWEVGLGGALREALGAGADGIGDEELLERYGRHEAALEAGPYLPYRSVLGRGLEGVAADLGIDVGAGAVGRFGGSVAEWPAFPDSAAALERLASRFRLGVLTNCDDDLFAASRDRLGARFAWVVTAQQVGAYKPAEAHFRALFERVGADGVDPGRVLHVAQSLYHDHVPAKRLGMTTVWIDRRRDRPGFGATPPAEVTPDARFASMEAFADAASPVTG